MKRVSKCTLGLLWAVCSAFAAKAQGVSQADKDHALQYLESTKKGVLDATKGLSDAQWKFKPGPDRWSVAEVMEHIAAAEGLLFLTTKQVMTPPPRPDGRD